MLKVFYLLFLGSSIYITHVVKRNFAHSVKIAYFLWEISTDIPRYMKQQVKLILPANVVRVIYCNARDCNTTYCWIISKYSAFVFKWTYVALLTSNKINMFSNSSNNFYEFDWHVLITTSLRHTRIATFKKKYN